MFKPFVVSAVVLITLLTPSFVRAGEDSERQTTLRERIQAKIERSKDKIEDRVESRQIRRDERTEKHAIRLQARFGNYYERLNSIITKVQTRISNLSADGKDMTLSQSKLNEAKVKLEDAKKLGEEAVTLFSSVEADKYQEQKNIALSASEKAKEARRAFMDVHKFIKESVKLAMGQEK